MKNTISISKTSLKILFILFCLSSFVTSCSKKKGCTNPLASNYDSKAEEDDGLCIINGCTNAIALNYNANANKDDGSCQLAGLGGNTTIVAKPQHHGVTIYNQQNYPDTAYVKFNTREFPGSDPSLYDAIFSGDPGEDHVHIGGLKVGFYFIWMAGFDTSSSERVTGGLPIKLTQSTGEVEQIFPVTE